MLQWLKKLRQFYAKIAIKISLTKSESNYALKMFRKEDASKYANQTTKRADPSKLKYITISFFKKDQNIIPKVS